MKLVLVLVEGRTEEAFIKDVLVPALRPALELIPTVVKTKPNVGAPAHKGGGDFSKFKRDALKLLGHSNAVAVTMFYDFYGFPQNIPNVSTMVYQNINQLEQTIAAQFKHHPRHLHFKPYLQRHEFEAFLFIDPQLTAKVALKNTKANAIAAHCQGFASVEDINLSRSTAPSKRLKSVLGAFDKLRLGSAVTQQLRLPALRAACPKFSAWVDWLESL